MRSSSVKTLVITVSMFAVVSATALTADARPARQTTRTTVSAPRKDEGAFSRAMATLRAVQRRVMAFATWGPPLPSPEPTTTNFGAFDPVANAD